MKHFVASVESKRRQSWSEGRLVYCAGIVVLLLQYELTTLGKRLMPLYSYFLSVVLVVSYMQKKNVVACGRPETYLHYRGTVTAVFLFLCHAMRNILPTSSFPPPQMFPIRSFSCRGPSYLVVGSVVCLGHGNDCS